MREVVSCKICGKILTEKSVFDVCPACAEDDERVFNSIRDYLRDNPKAKIFEVSTVLEIPVKRIKRYLKEGRIEIVEDDNRFLLCEKCGCSIKSGRFCDKCREPQQLHIVGSARSGEQTGNIKLNRYSNNRKRSTSLGKL